MCRMEERIRDSREGMDTEEIWTAAVQNMGKRNSGRPQCKVFKTEWVSLFHGVCDQQASLDLE